MVITSIATGNNIWKTPETPLRPKQTKEEHTMLNLEKCQCAVIAGSRPGDCIVAVIFSVKDSFTEKMIPELIGNDINTIDTELILNSDESKRRGYTRIQSLDMKVFIPKSCNVTPSLLASTFNMSQGLIDKKKFQSVVRIFLPEKPLKKVPEECTL